MNCFNHPERIAIGSCKACCRGLCMECAADLGHGLACKNRHEKTVEMHNMIVERSARMVTRAPKGSFLLPVFFVFVGIGLSAMVFFTDRRASGWDYLVSIGFVVFGVILLIYVRAYNRRVYGNQANG